MREGAWSLTIPGENISRSMRSQWKDWYGVSGNYTGPSYTDQFPTTSKSGFRTRNWKQLKKIAQLPVTSASCVFTGRAMCSPGTYFEQDKQKSSVFYRAEGLGGTIYSHLTNAPSDVAGAYSDAYTSLLESYKAQEVDLTKVLAEIKETSIGMSSLVEKIESFTFQVMDKFRRLEKDFQYKRGRWRKFKRGVGRKALHEYSNALADIWLEYSFNIKPLIMDVQDSAKALSAIYEGHLPKPRIRGIGTRSTSGSQYQTWSFSAGPFGSVNFAGCTTTKAYRIVKLTARCDFRASLIDSMALSGLDPRNIVGAAWEITPWSWLVDYFSNFGNYLDALAWGRLDITHGCRIDIVKTTTRTVAGPVDPNRGSWVIGSPFTSSREDFSFSRAPWSGYLPDLTLTVHVGLLRALNLLAVAEGYLGRLPMNPRRRSAF